MQCIKRIIFVFPYAAEFVYNVIFKKTAHLIAMLDSNKIRWMLFYNATWV
jgi:hypothetical protein